MQCIHCKHETRDGKRVGESEILCPDCYEQLKAFKTQNPLDFYVDGDLPDGVLRIVLDHIESARVEIRQQYPGNEDLDVLKPDKKTPKHDIEYYEAPQESDCNDND